LAYSGNQHAFGDLASLLHELLDWFHVAAVLSNAALGSHLRRSIPEKEAIEKYLRGEHVSAWAGVELARIYKDFKAQLESRSKNAEHRLTQLLYGFTVGDDLEFPPNVWFGQAYRSKKDYRPSGRMAVWFARQIEGIRQLKRNHEFRLIVHFAVKKAELPFELPISAPEAESPFQLPVSAPDLIQGQLLQKLAALPPFGETDESLKKWREFIRHRLRTNKRAMAEFDGLFPGARANFDGTLRATIEACWKAAGQGGQTVIR
jgi:hypothetical protein